MVDFGIVIPARYGSTRLPGKPLREIAGKPMIQWVVENAQRAGAKFVWVATDDERIRKAVESFGGEAIMTSPDHTTGTDRLAEVVRLREVPPETIIVNVQGDEPLLPEAAMATVASELQHAPDAGIATLAHRILNPRELFDPNVVKVVLDSRSFARYFSRAPIPWVRDLFGQGEPQSLPLNVPFYQHMGIYSYRARVLIELAEMTASCVEAAESLEQLRAIEVGIPIKVGVSSRQLHSGVDTECQLLQVQRILSGKPSS